MSKPARRRLEILLCCVLPLAGCISAVTKEFRLYDGPVRPPDQISVLVSVLNTQIDIDGQVDVNPESHVWGGRYQLLPGTHRVTARPYSSFLGPGYENLPPLLPDYTMDFDAAAGKQYFLHIDKQIVEKTKIAETDTKTTYLVGNIQITFYIREKGTQAIVSRPANP